MTEKKIAYIVNDFPSLSESFILNQIVGLKKRGIDVDILAGKKGSYDKLHPDIIQYKLTDSLYVLNSASKLKKAVLLLKAFISKPIVTIKNFSQIIKHPNYLFLIEHFKKYHYDILFCHFGTRGLLITKLKEAHYIHNTKIIITFHGYDLSRFLKTEGEDVYKKLKKTADLFLPISLFWKEKLLSLGFDEKKITVHHMGIDINKFNYLKREERTSAPITILSICRFTEKKGINYALLSISELKKQVTNFNYKIVGYGPLEENLQRQCAELGIQEHVSFLGSKNSEEISDLMKTSDIFLLPSITAHDGDMEGIPVVLMEAMATGLPVVSTYHSGIPELVIHNENGLLSKEKNEEGLASNLLSLISNANLRRELGISGRKKVEQEFNIEILNNTLVDILGKYSNSASLITRNRKQ